MIGVSVRMLVVAARASVNERGKVAKGSLFLDYSGIIIFNEKLLKLETLRSI